MAQFGLRELVRKSSGDEFLTMRLLRDKIPGVGNRYIQFPPEQLVAELDKHSPLSQVARLVAADDTTGQDTQGGEKALPAVVENEQSGTEMPETALKTGGDGGGSNSPSRRSCPEYATSLVNS